MEKATPARSGESGLQPKGAHGSEAATVNAEVKKLETLIKQFNQKEREMLAVGGEHIAKISMQTQRLGAQIAKSRGGGDVQSQVIGAAVGVAVGAALSLYNHLKARSLAEGRKKFAVENFDTLEELGRKLRQAGCDSVNLFTALEKKELVILDEESLPGYQLVLKSLGDYQRSILYLAERYEVFRTYYGAIAEWAGQEVDPPLVEPFLDCSRWIEERVRSAEEATRNSSSLLYHFSLQGHLLLFLPSEHSPSLVTYAARAQNLFDYYVHPPAGLKITERFDYVTKSRELLSGSQLEKHVEKKYHYVRRRHSLYLKRYWIIFGSLLIVGLIVAFIAALLAFLGSVLRALFS